VVLALTNALVKVLADNRVNVYALLDLKAMIAVCELVHLQNLGDKINLLCILNPNVQVEVSANALLVHAHALMALKVQHVSVLLAQMIAMVMENAEHLVSFQRFNSMVIQIGKSSVFKSVYAMVVSLVQIALNDFAHTVMIQKLFADIKIDKFNALLLTFTLTQQAQVVQMLMHQQISLHSSLQQFLVQTIQPP